MLAQGSRKIDQMKEDIERVAQIIVSQLSSLAIEKGWYGIGGKHAICFDFAKRQWDEHHWNVGLQDGDDDKRKIGMWCWIDRGLECQVQNGMPGSRYLNPKTVKQVHKSLQSVVKQLFKEYPELKARCAPFLRSGSWW